MKTILGSPRSPVKIYRLIQALEETGRGRMRSPEAKIFSRISELRSRYAPGTWLGRMIPLSSISESMGRTLFHLVRKVQPKVCIELGTGAGISTLYLAAALHLNRAGALWSLDRNPGLIALAHQRLSLLSLGAPCHFVCGPFRQTVRKTFRKLRQIDFAFIDGNHRRAPTLRYFSDLLRVLRPGGTVVFDDIRWTPGMFSAWQAIQRHRAVGSAFDCDRFGIVVSRS